MNTLDVFRLALSIACWIPLVLIIASMPRSRWQPMLNRGALTASAIVLVAFLISALLGKPMHFVLAAIWVFTTFSVWTTGRINARTRRSAR